MASIKRRKVKVKNKKKPVIEKLLSKYLGIKNLSLNN
jgi:hypothetical protein